MAAARPVGPGFFPLDEELGLLPGSLSPQFQDHLTRLAAWMPFERAAEMLAVLTGVQVSEATTRRQTYTAEAAYEAVQAAQVAAPEEPAPPVRADKLVLSADGAMVPRVAWAVGRSQNAGHRRGASGSGSGRSAVYAPVLLLAPE